MSALPRIGGQCVALVHGAAAIADTVQVEVHGAQAHNLIDDIDAGKSFVPETPEPLAVFSRPPANKRAKFQVDRQNVRKLVMA
jgi:hypothetical protein